MPKQQPKTKAKTTAVKPVPRTFKVSRTVVTKTANFFKVFATGTETIGSANADIDKSTAALGVAIDSHGFWLLPLMDGRPNATYKTWYEGTKDCPEKGYKRVFPNSGDTAEEALEENWNATNAYIQTLRVTHAASDVKDTVEFRHCLMFIKRHCQYWQGIQQTKAALARAEKKEIPALFKKAKAAGFNKPRTGKKGSSTVTPGTHTWKTVDQHIKNAVASLEIIQTKALSTGTETSQRDAAHCSNVLANLEVIQTLRVTFSK